VTELLTSGWFNYKYMCVKAHGRHFEHLL